MDIQVVLMQLVAISSPMFLTLKRLYEKINQLP